MRKVLPILLIILVVLGAAAVVFKLRGGNLFSRSPEQQQQVQRKTANVVIDKVFAQMEQGIALVNQTSDAKSGTNPEQAITAAVEQFQAAQTTLASSTLPSEYTDLRVKLNQMLGQLTAATQKLRDGAKTQNGGLLNQGTEEFSMAVKGMDELRALREQLR
jgi:hypothetical protein